MVEGRTQAHFSRVASKVLSVYLQRHSDQKISGCYSRMLVCFLFGYLHMKEASI